MERQRYHFVVVLLGIRTSPNWSGSFFEKIRFEMVPGRDNDNLFFVQHPHSYDGRFGVVGRYAVSCPARIVAGFLLSLHSYAA